MVFLQLENMREFTSRFDTCWNLNSVQSMIMSVSRWPVLMKMSGIFFSKIPASGLRLIYVGEDCLKENKTIQPTNMRWIVLSPTFKHKYHHTLMERMSTDCKHCKEFCWLIYRSLPSTFTIRIDDDIPVRLHTIPENSELFNRQSTQVLKCCWLLNEIGVAKLLLL